MSIMDWQQWCATIAIVDGPQRPKSNYKCMKLIVSKQSSNYQCIDSGNAQEIARLMLLNVFEYESGFVVKLYLNNIGHAILNFYLTFAERSSSCSERHYSVSRLSNNISNDLIYIDLSTFHMC